MDKLKFRFDVDGNVLPEKISESGQSVNRFFDALKEPSKVDGDKERADSQGLSGVSFNGLLRYQENGDFIVEFISDYSAGATQAVMSSFLQLRSLESVLVRGVYPYWEAEHSEVVEEYEIPEDMYREITETVGFHGGDVIQEALRRDINIRKNVPAMIPSEVEQRFIKVENDFIEPWWDLRTAFPKELAKVLKGRVSEAHIGNLTRWADDSWWDEILDSEVFEDVDLSGDNLEFCPDKDNELFELSQRSERLENEARDRVVEALRFIVRSAGRDSDLNSCIAHTVFRLRNSIKVWARNLWGYPDGYENIYAYMSFLENLANIESNQTLIEAVADKIDQLWD